MTQTMIPNAPSLPPDTSTDAGFWDKVAPKYSRKPIENVPAYERKLAMTRRYLKPHMDVLELGCGTGGTARKHAGRVNRITATDFSPAMIAIARERLADTSIDNVDFRVASVEDFAAPAAGYDVVLALSLLHLLQDREEAIRKVAMLLKPGGLFITTTPCIGDTMAWFRFVQPVGAFLGLMPTLDIFTKRELRREMLGAGFAIEEEFEPKDGRTLFMVARLVAG